MLCGSDILRGVGILDFELVMGILKDFQLLDGAALVIYLLLEKLYIVLQVLDAHHGLPFLWLSMFLHVQGKGRHDSELLPCQRNSSKEIKA